MQIEKRKAGAIAVTPAITEFRSSSTSLMILAKAVAKKCPRISDILSFLALMMLPLTAGLAEPQINEKDPIQNTLGGTRYAILATIHQEGLRMWAKRLYEDFRRIIQKTVRRYPALETALSALSMLSIVLTAGLAEQRPAWATVAALAGMLAALTLRGADCSTTGVQSRTESNRRRAGNTWATASPAHWTARRSSRFRAGTISKGGREL